MTSSLLNLLLKFAKPAQASRQLMRNTIKDSLITKSAMERFKTNAIRTRELTNTTISKEYYERWVKDAVAGRTVPPPTSLERYNKIVKSRNKEVADYYNSPKFALDYKNQMTKNIDEVPINFFPRGHSVLSSGSSRNVVGSYYPRGITRLTQPEIVLMKNSLGNKFLGYNRAAQLSTGVHELKHAAQYGGRFPWRVDMPNLMYPEKAIKEIINKNMIRMPRFATKGHKKYIEYLRKPQEVSARLEEIRAMRKTGSILERWRINNSNAMLALKRVFGSVKKVLEVEKQIWGLAPIGTAGLLNNSKEN